MAKNPTAVRPAEAKLFQALEKLPLDEIVPAYTHQVPGETSLQNIPKKFGNGTGFLIALEKFFKKAELGKYPKDYKPRVHGPYNPGTYYGPADSIMETKLADVPKWIMRRDRSVLGASRFFSRTFWRWNMNWLHAKSPGMTPIYQLVCMFSAYFLLVKYKASANVRHAKYH